MRCTIIFISLIAVLSSDINSQSFFGSPLAHTYSIVAFDPVTKEIGVAVQSHWFSVGTVVTWGEAGVGVVATQSFVNASFGVRGLELLQKGFTPEQVVDSLISNDEGRDYRQLAILNASGDVAAFTGKNCISAAGHIAGKNYSVQANLMSNDKIWGAMSAAFENSKGPLAERMLAALEAAEEAGGDIRGKQSAAMLVFSGTPTGKVWIDKLIDIRVDDNPDPLKELARLLKVHRAYDHMNRGDLAVEKGDMETAMKEYSAAEKMFPDNEEMKFWHAVTLANKGMINESLPLFKEVFVKNKNYLELTPRLVPVGLLNVNEEELARILSEK